MLKADHHRLTVEQVVNWCLGANNIQITSPHKFTVSGAGVLHVRLLYGGRAASHRVQGPGGEVQCQVAVDIQ